MSGLQPTGDATLAPNSSAAWTERYRGAVMDTFGPPQRVLVRGEGAYVWDADGKRYLDLLAGIAVNALGHAHPTLTAAISAITCQTQAPTPIRKTKTMKLLR